MGWTGVSPQAWVTKTEQKMDLAVRKIALELFSRVILKTPVDTGRARANWQIAIGSMPNGVLELDDKSGTATISKGSAVVAGVKGGDVIYIVSNLPYINRLEDGYSKQAPAGMLGLTVQELQQVVRQIGAELVRI